MEYVNFIKIRKQEGKTYSRRRIVVDILRFIFGRDGHKTLEKRGGKVLALNFGFFTVKRIDNYKMFKKR